MLPQDILETNRSARLAILSEQGHFSYESLDDMANRLARYFATKGLTGGERISLLVGNDPLLVACYFGAFKAGAIANPLNNRLTPRELAYVINHAGSRGLVVSDEFLPVLKMTLPLIEHTPCILALHAHGPLPFAADNETEVFAQSARPLTAERPQPGDGALLIYTSGTTGNPKGVVLTHANVIEGAKIISPAFEIKPTDRTLCVMPLFHTNALMFSHMPFLFAGATVILRKRFSNSAFWGLCKQYEANSFSASPTILAMIMENEASAPPLKDIGLKLVKVASAPTPADLAERFENRFGKGLLLETFGLTETTTMNTMNPLHGKRKFGSIGKALGPQEIRIVDADGIPLPQGEVGELAIRGCTVMKEYFRDPENTARTIREGWLHSGDMARMDEDGFFFIVGRKKEMILRGGENISPLEVEQVAARHPAVREAAAVGIPDRIWGEIVGLAVVPSATLTEEALRDFCRTQLSAFKVPERIVLMDQLPRNAMGKVTRNALKDSFPAVAK